MEAKPIHTLVVYSQKPSIPFTKIPFRICSNPFRSSSCTSSSLSKSGSFAIKCINGNVNASSDQRTDVNVRELKNLLAGLLDEFPGELPNIDELDNLLRGIADEVLKCEETRVLFDGLNKATQRVELAKIKKQEIKMKKMKQYINQLEIRVAEIEKCQNELSEAKTLVEEAKRFLQVEFGDQNSMKTETERCEIKKVASISAIIDTLTNVLLD